MSWKSEKARARARERERTGLTELLLTTYRAWNLTQDITTELHRQRDILFVELTSTARELDTGTGTMSFNVDTSDRCGGYSTPSHALSRASRLKPLGCVRC